MVVVEDPFGLKRLGGSGVASYQNQFDISRPFCSCIVR